MHVSVYVSGEVSSEHEHMTDISRASPPGTRRRLKRGDVVCSWLWTGQHAVPISQLSCALRVRPVGWPALLTHPHWSDSLGCTPRSRRYVFFCVFPIFLHYLTIVQYTHSSLLGVKMSNKCHAVMRHTHLGKWSFFWHEQFEVECSES